MTRYPKKVKLQSPAALRDAYGEVAARARRDRVRVALIGGYAMMLYGSSRLTGDLDVVASRVPRGLRNLGDLPFGGRKTLAGDGVPVDVVVRDDKWRRLYVAALRDAVVDDEIDLPIVLPEYLAAMKMVAARDKDEIDLKFLIQEGVLDLDEAREIIEEHLGAYAVDDFDRYVDEVEWEKVRRK